LNDLLFADLLFADLLFADLLFADLLFAGLLFADLLFADLLFADDFIASYLTQPQTLPTPAHVATISEKKEGKEPNSQYPAQNSYFVMN